MPVTRRSFLRTLGAGSAALALPLPVVAARGLEAAVGEGRRPGRVPPPAGIRLDSNENPYGPAPEALQALHETLGESCRYPDFVLDELLERLEASLGVPKDHLLLGCGSGEILKVATEAFVTRDRHLVTGAPTFETPERRATALELPVRAIPVDAALRLDLQQMADAAQGAGLVFLCNPNNPTGTLYGSADVLAAIGMIFRASPDCTVLVDEAYHEYVEDPGYASMVPLALREPRVIVARTFSKIHGMAGLRCGMAVGRPETLKRMAPHCSPNNVNVLVAAAARASLGANGHVERERQKNSEARSFAQRAFSGRGYAVVPSQANFFMVDVRRPVAEFREACRAQGVMVGRPFPPLETHVRISVGTMDEMRQAVAVFGELLA
jgi:histidinol-phosphate aminotransferase